MLPNEGVNQERSPLGTGESYPNERQREPRRVVRDVSGSAASRKDQNRLERSRAAPPRKPALGDNKRGHVSLAPGAGDPIEEFWSDIRSLGDYLEKGMQRTKQMLTAWWKSYTKESHY